jgi:hypothetical protein
VLFTLLSTFGIFLNAMGVFYSKNGHIPFAIIVFIFTIFTQAFVMFYFIGVARFLDNLHNEINASENPETVKSTWIKALERYRHNSTINKRKVIPWTMLTLVLGMIAFFMGGAHDSGITDKYIHVGTVYGFLVSLLLSAFFQWNYLGKNHEILRIIKTGFEIEDHQM